GVAIGAAMNGLRPVAEIQFADYIHPAYDQIVNEAAKIRYRSNGTFGCPVVFRAPFGAGVHGGLYHSQSVEALFFHVPGLNIGVHLALEASERLAADGIDVEILDLRTLLPLDTDAIKETVARTSKVLILHEDNKTGGIGAEVAALIAEEAFEELDGPIMRLAAADTHIPYAPSLEEAILPNADDVAQAVRRLAEY